VQASTLGSLEALLEFLRSDAVKIPVSGINIGPVHKRDVMRASTMLEKGRKKFAVILAFDVPVTREAQEQATSTGVRIFTADIIYHLFDQFSAYLKHVSLLDAGLERQQVGDQKFGATGFCYFGCKTAVRTCGKIEGGKGGPFRGWFLVWSSAAGKLDFRCSMLGRLYTYLHRRRFS